jgi:Putative prokaryotic signal transducing protein
MRVDELTRVTVVHDETEAEMVCALLRTAGVRAFHRQTNAGAGAADGMPQVGAQEVVVAAGDLDRAREVLAAEPGAS